jgi:hypothetical protein
MEVKQLVGWNIRRVRQERGLTIEALAHQAHVSAAWLGEEFKNGQAPAASAAGLIHRRSRHPPVSGGTKQRTRPALQQRCASNTLGLSRSAACAPMGRLQQWRPGPMARDDGEPCPSPETRFRRWTYQVDGDTRPPCLPPMQTSG